MTYSTDLEEAPEHILAVARFLSAALNAGRKDVRFALLVWNDQQADIQGLISNDGNDKTVIGMLDNAKARIICAEAIQDVAGHA